MCALAGSLASKGWSSTWSAPDALPRPEAASHSTMIDSLSRSPSVLCVAARALRAVPRDAEPTGAVGLGQALTHPLSPLFSIL